MILQIGVRTTTEHAHEQGYVLVEAILVAVLLCAGLILIARSIQSPLWALGTLERRAEAIALLQEEADRIRMEGDHGPAGRDAETRPDSLQIERTYLGIHSDCHTIRLTARWRDHGTWKRVSTDVALRVHSAAAGGRDAGS
jgi:hypothetical protein